MFINGFFPWFRRTYNGLFANPSQNDTVQLSDDLQTKIEKSVSNLQLSSDDLENEKGELLEDLLSDIHEDISNLQLKDEDKMAMFQRAFKKERSAFLQGKIQTYSFFSMTKIPIVEMVLDETIQPSAFV